MKPAVTGHAPLLFLLITTLMLLGLSGASAQSLTWERINGIPGGSIHAVIIDSSGRTYAASGAGIYRSIDDGESWSDNLFMRGANIIEMAADVDGRIYAIEGNLAGKNRIYRSATHGTTWEEIDSTRLPNLLDLAVLQNGIIIGIDDNGTIQRSLDHGDSWERAKDRSTAASLALVTPSGRIYANDYARILRSTDQGKSWSVLEEDLPFADINAVVEMADGTLLAATGEGIYGSTDDGMHWKLVKTGQVGMDGLQQLDRSARALALTPGGRLIAGFLGYGNDPARNYIVASDDGGKSWSTLDSSIAVVTELDGGAFATGFVIGGRGRLYMGIEDDGLYMSEDEGRRWDQVDWSFSNNDIWQMATDSEGRLFVVSDDNFYRTDDGIHWKKLSHRGTTPFAIGPNGVIIARSYFDNNQQQVTRSTDHGDHWDSLNTLQAQNVTAVAFNSGGHIFLGLESNAILRSTDNGATWSSRGESSIPAGLTIRDLAINSRGELFASTFRGTGGSAMPALYRSADSGVTWEKVFDSVGIALLAIGPRDEIYFSSGASGSPLYRSSDDGASFDMINNHPGAFEDTFNALAVDELGRLFLGTRSYGAFLSVDSGEVWVGENRGLAERTVRSIATGPHDAVYIDVEGKIFRASTEMLAVDEEPVTAAIPLLALPNPARERAAIRFTLRSAAHATLRVHDATGSVVATLVDGEMRSGAHEIMWDGTGSPSGIYTVSLRAGGRVHSTKLMLVR